MRTALDVPLTTMEKLCVVMIARDGFTYDSIAKRLCTTYGNVRFHTNNAARKIPSQGLTVQEAIKFWWRGATRDQLMGVADED